MIKVTGKRGSGKTTKLLELAHENGYILVEPTFRAVDHVRQMAEEKGYGDVEILAACQFNMRNPGLFVKDADNRYLIDELDMVLSQMNVVGYSDTDVEESNA